MNNEDFTFSVDERTNRRVVRLNGCLELTNIDEFKKPVLEIIEKDQKEILFDLSGLKHIDSSGIGLILLVHRKLVAAGRNFILASLNERVKSIFVTAGLDKMLTINETEE